MHVWHVQTVAEQQPLSAHPALLQAVAELGTHRLVPSPILAEISGSAARSLQRSGASGLLRQERKRGSEDHPPLSSSPIHKSTSPPLWTLNAEGEQRVLSERAQGRHRVGAAGKPPSLPPRLPSGGSWIRLPPHAAVPAPSSHAALGATGGGGDSEPLLCREKQGVDGGASPLWGSQGWLNSKLQALRGPGLSLNRTRPTPWLATEGGWEGICGRWGRSAGP